MGEFGIHFQKAKQTNNAIQHIQAQKAKYKQPEKQESGKIFNENEGH
jgi:hypothetical protein